MRRRGGSWRRNWGRRFRERKGGLECDGMVYKGWKEGSGYGYGYAYGWIWVDCMERDFNRYLGDV